MPALLPLHCCQDDTEEAEQIMVQVDEFAPPYQPLHGVMKPFWVQERITGSQQ
jgi:hypothetical protein